MDNLQSKSYGEEDSQERLIHCKHTYHRLILLRLMFVHVGDTRMHAFNQSLKYDQRMHAADIRGSIAYAKSLTKVGILTQDEEEKITEGLAVVGQEWASGTVGLLRCSSVC